MVWIMQIHTTPNWCRLLKRIYHFIYISSLGIAPLSKRGEAEGLKLMKGEVFGKIVVNIVRLSTLIKKLIKLTK